MPIPTSGIRAPDPSQPFDREIKRAVDVLRDSPLFKGVLLENVQLSTTPTRVNHNLGRVPRGFFVVMATDDVRVWINGKNTTGFTFLDANTTATVSLWIF